MPHRGRPSPTHSLGWCFPHLIQSAPRRDDVPRKLRPQRSLETQPPGASLWFRTWMSLMPTGLSPRSSLIPLSSVRQGPAHAILKGSGHLIQGEDIQDGDLNIYSTHLHAYAQDPYDIAIKDSPVIVDGPELLNGKLKVAPLKYAALFSAEERCMGHGHYKEVRCHRRDQIGSER